MVAATVTVPSMTGPPGEITTPLGQRPGVVTVAGSDAADRWSSCATDTTTYEAVVWAVVGTCTRFGAPYCCAGRGPS
jgi:hypothetical protein